eukprot:124435-Rhodomonas_salina.2
MDECAAGTHECPNGKVCVNTVGSYDYKKQEWQQERQAQRIQVARRGTARICQQSGHWYSPRDTAACLRHRPHGHGILQDPRDGGREWRYYACLGVGRDHEGKEGNLDSSSLSDLDTSISAV